MPKAIYAIAPRLPTPTECLGGQNPASFSKNRFYAPRSSREPRHAISDIV
ncbi:MAG: hypothetical protein IJZ04_08365 [Clostridia bacterium]|nr:hypothetical protein [Clostridia bacterium]